VWTGTVIAVAHSDLPQFVTTVTVLICCITGQISSAYDAGWTQKTRLCQGRKGPKVRYCYYPHSLFKTGFIAKVLMQVQSAILSFKN
jgi:hypothetical protein